MARPAERKSPRVLFVCMANCCRSQMAEGLARRLAPNWQIFSAGLMPAGYVSSHAIRSMREAGIDISLSASKGLDEVDTDSMDVIVAMGGFPCSDFVSRPEGKVLREWLIPDPLGHSMAFFKDVRNQIETKIAELFEEVGLGQKQG